MKAIFHIGAAKCGSSALQRFLSTNPELVARNGAGFVYCTFNSKKNGVLEGSEVTRYAANNLYGYCSSPKLEILYDILQSSQTVAASLRQLERSGRTPVFSSEAWGSPAQFDRLFSEGALERLGLSPELVLYIRPQAALLNSFWWQWGAWTGHDFERWFEKSLAMQGHWDRFIDACDRYPAIRGLQLRILHGDIVRDFLQLLDIPEEGLDLPRERLNSTLPRVILRMYQRHPELRKVPNPSTMDFVLERHFRTIGGKAPWVLDQEHLERIAETYRRCNERLFDYLDEDQKQVMRENRSWWEPQEHSRPPEPPSGVPPDTGELEQVARHAFAAIYGLEKELKNCRSRNDVAEGGATPRPGGVRRLVRAAKNLFWRRRG